MIFSSSLTTCVTNFASKHHGKAVGLIEGTVTGVSPALLATIYTTIFSKNNYDDSGKQNAQGYLLFLAINSTLTYSLCVAFLKSFPYECDEINNPDETVTLTETALHRYGISINDNNCRTQKHAVDFINGCMQAMRILYHCVKNNTAYLFSVEMQWCIWSFTLLGVTNSLFYNNNSIILNYLNFNDYIPLVGIALPVASIFFDYVISSISDYFLDRCPRMVYVFVISILLTLTQILQACLFDHVGVVVIAMIVNAATNSSLWILMIAIVTEQTKVEDFARNWGTISFSFSIGQFLIAYVFGRVYDMHAQSDHHCEGNDCFFWTFIACAIGCCVAFIFTFIMLFRRQENQGR